MQHFTDPNPRPIQRFARTRFGKAADADHPFGLQMADQCSQMCVARGVQRCRLARGKLVRRQVAPVVKERQRTIVGDKMIGKESLGRTEALLKQAP